MYNVPSHSLKPDDPRYYVHYCTMCFGEMLVPMRDYGAALDEFMSITSKVMLAYKMKGNLSCPYCEHKVSEDTLKNLFDNIPDYTIEDNEIARVYFSPATSKEKIDSILVGSIPYTELHHTVARFYKGRCVQCNSRFMYTESKNLKQSDISNEVLNVLEDETELLMAPYRNTENASYWMCPHCHYFLMPENKYASENGWGANSASYALHQDGMLYKVNQLQEDIEEIARRDFSRPTTVKYSSSSSSSKSRSSYSGYVYTDPMEDIMDLLNFPYRPKPSTAHLQMLAN